LSYARFLNNVFTPWLFDEGQSWHSNQQDLMALA